MLALALCWLPAVPHVAHDALVALEPLESIRARTFLVNHTQHALWLQPCSQPLPGGAVLGVGLESASEEFVRLTRDGCAHVCACEVESPGLQFEHGSQTRVVVMPEAFQPPDGRLFALPEAIPPVQQHERAQVGATRICSHRQLTMSVIALSVTLVTRSLPSPEFASLVLLKRPWCSWRRIGSPRAQGASLAAPTSGHFAACFRCWQSC